jgi:hypothetical protein
MNALIKALIQAKLAFKPIPKDAVNTFFKSRYTTLDAILAAVEPALHANDLCIIQRVEGSRLITELHHASGEKIGSEYPLPDASEYTTARDALILGIIECGTSDADIDKQARLLRLVGELSTPQKFGSALTYARRYAICSMLSVTADEDDDANSASGKKPVTTPAKKQAPTPTPQPTGNFITPAQVQRLQIELRQHEYTAEMMAAFKKDLGVDSAKKIQANQWQAAMDRASDPQTAAYYRQQCAEVAA